MRSTPGVAGLHGLCAFSRLGLCCASLLHSAGYYAYLWSEVLDADAFAAFRASGDIFNPTLAGRLKEHIYESGGSENAEVMYRKFLGRDPDVGAFLESRGLNR